jgi:CHASE2 domain-containing sensor protein
MKTGSFVNSFLVIKRLLTNGGKFVFERVSIYKRYFLRALLIGFILSVIVTTMAWLGHFKPYENRLTDFLQSISRKEADDVVLLFITEREYKQNFGGTSPLSRTRLAEMIDMLVKLRARVVALDIDMSDCTPEDDRLLAALTHASSAGIPIVFIASCKEIAEKTPLGSGSSGSLSPYPEAAQHYTDRGFFLFEDVSPGSQWMGKVMYGGVVFRLDPDGVFRQAEVLYCKRDSDAKGNVSSQSLPSFPVAVAAAYQGMSQEEIVEALSDFPNNDIILSPKGKHHLQRIPGGTGGRIIPNFIGDYRYFQREVNLTRLLEDYGSGKPGGLTVFRDKIVMVGGTYDKKDFFMTPVGRISGTEVLANVTQSILSGNLITRANFGKAFAIQIILGAIVALLFILIPRVWATIICFVILVPMVATASILSFSTSYYWVSFIPTIAGVMLHGWVKRVEDYLLTKRRRGDS